MNVFLKASILVTVFWAVAASSSFARATVDVGYVSNITKECVFIEDDALYVPIGFASCGERCSNHLDVHCEALGYTYLGSRPSYAVEMWVGVAALAFVALKMAWRLAWRKKRSVTHG